MTIEKEILMESIRNIQNFKRFLELNKDKLYAIAEDANSIRIDDEWMQEDIWDEVYDNNWECWLFPYCKTQEPNKENVDRYANSLLRSNTTTSYVALATHCKYSEKDKVYKRYKHLLYKIDLSDVPEHMNTSLFELKNIKYSWKSIKELESDNNVMTKNDDIIAFVKANIS